MQEQVNNGAPQERTFVATTSEEWHAEAPSESNSAQVDDFVANTEAKMVKARKIMETGGYRDFSFLNPDAELKVLSKQLADYTKAVKEFE